MSPPLAAARGGCSRATAYRLWRRYRESGWAALQDRPSTPRRQPRRLPAEVEQRIVATRRRTAYGPVRLAGLVPHPPSTIGKVLRRQGYSRLPRPQAAARCARRYERERPGELLHVDTKQLGRFWGARQARARRRGRPPASQPADRLAAPPCRDRRPLAAGLRRAPRGPRRGELRLLPRAGGRVVGGAGRHGRAGTDRQCEGLPRPGVGGGHAKPRGRAPLHAHLPTAHEREGRALHPDPARRVGIRAELSLERRARSGTKRLPALVQQTPPARLAPGAATGQPRLTPLWSRQLATHERASLRHREVVQVVGGALALAKNLESIASVECDCSSVLRRDVELEVVDSCLRPSV
jgi:transposase